MFSLGWTKTRIINNTCSISLKLLFFRLRAYCFVGKIRKIFLVGSKEAQQRFRYRFLFVCACVLLVNGNIQPGTEIYWMTPISLEHTYIHKPNHSNKHIHTHTQTEVYSKCAHKLDKPPAYWDCSQTNAFLSLHHIRLTEAQGQLRDSCSSVESRYIYVVSWKKVAKKLLGISCKCSSTPWERWLLTICVTLSETNW